jgi:uncharacterized protein (DUF2164 family)
VADIKFTPNEKEAISQKIKQYVSRELKQEISRFEAEFLLDFFTEEVGGYYYNRGLYDAQTIIAARLDDIQDAVLQLEKPVEYKK